MAGTPLVGEREERGTVLTSGLNMSGKIHAEGIHIDHIVGDKIAKRWACNNFTEVFNRLRAHAGK